MSVKGQTYLVKITAKRFAPHVGLNDNIYSIQSVSAEKIDAGGINAVIRKDGQELDPGVIRRITKRLVELKYEKGLPGKLDTLANKRTPPTAQADDIVARLLEKVNPQPPPATPPGHRPVGIGVSPNAPLGAGSWLCLKGLA